MKLHYRTMGEGHPVIILHGVFGTSDNWQTFAKQLADRYQIFLPDQRNHGLSPHDEAFDYHVMSEDLREFIEEHKLENPVILGHSMGGKVAMFFATIYPDQFEKMIVVDIAPRAYPVHHQKILEALAAVKIGEISSRKEAEDQMKPYIADFGIRQFLLKNLKREDNNSFTWKLNLSAIRQNIERIGEAVDESHAVEKPVLFVGGEKSEYIRKDDHPLITQIFPQSRIVTIPRSGHWIHAEQPGLLLEEVEHFLRD
jgi:esterase